MNPILFVAALIASFIIVRIGAIAFQLTGLEWSLANSPSDLQIQSGDRLLCFGQLNDMRQEFEIEPPSASGADAASESV